MEINKIKQLLEKVKNKDITIDEAVKHFRDLPFKDLDFVKLDHHREIRKGLSEVIYCPNKSLDQLKIIGNEFANSGKNGILYTRVNSEQAKLLLSIDKSLKHNEKARMIYKPKAIQENDNFIMIVTGGTSDIPVAEEANCTAITMGNRVEKAYDVGVAGIHRLFSVYDRLQEASVIIAIAGMEGALASVVSGLVGVPVIAVPTSIGYGANFGGLAPLLSMLNSCSPGIACVNIDNGFGAGYIASMINQGGNK